MLVRLAALAVLVVALAAPSSALASRRCVNVTSPYLSAREVRTFGGFSCSTARALVSRYFRQVVRSGQIEGGCAQLRNRDGCTIGNYVCTVRATYTLRGRCSDGVRSVTFREVDYGPG